MLVELVSILENVTELTLDKICYLSVISVICGKYVILPLVKKFFRGIN